MTRTAQHDRLLAKQGKFRSAGFAVLALIEDTGTTERQYKRSSNGKHSFLFSFSLNNAPLSLRKISVEGVRPAITIASQPTNASISPRGLTSKRACHRPKSGKDGLFPSYLGIFNIATFCNTPASRHSWIRYLV
jgi:hypothetical protein